MRKRLAFILGIAGLLGALFTLSACPVGDETVSTPGSAGDEIGSGSGTAGPSSGATGSGAGGSSGSDVEAVDEGWSDDEGDATESTGTPEAAPPSGPEEIPGPTALRTVRFPETIAIDLDRVTGGSAGATLALSSIHCTGEFCDAILMGAEMVSTLNMFAKDLFSVLSDLDAEVGVDQTSVTDLISASHHDLAGQEIFCDFRGFTSARSETANCSLTDDTKPLCIRCYVGGRRFVAGFLKTAATASQDGAGWLWLDPPESFFHSTDLPLEEKRIKMGLIWDHTDLANRKTEMFQDGCADSGCLREEGRMIVTQAGSTESTSLKTVLMDSRFERSVPVMKGSFDYIGRWFEDQEPWSGKVHSEIGSMIQENPDICASLVTGNRLDDLYCRGELDTDSLNFIDPRSDTASPSDSVWPLSLSDFSR